MADTPDKSRAHVKLARPVRAALGALVLLAALVFLLTAAAILVGDRSKMPSPQGALVLGLFFAALGLGFSFIGVRLVKMKEATDNLFSTRAALIAGPLTSVIGLVVAVSAIYYGGHTDAIPAGIALMVMGLGVYRSGRKRKAAFESSLANNQATEYPTPKPDPGGAHIDKADAAKPADISSRRTRAFGWTVAIVVGVGAVLAVRAYRTVPSSQWLISAQYQREFDTRAREGFYPHAVEGKCQSDGEKFRAEWKATPTGATFLAHHGMTRQDYDRRDAEYRFQGYSLGSLKHFKDCSGIDRYQATWLKR